MKKENIVNLYLETNGIDVEKYDVIVWPDSQQYMEQNLSQEDFSLINDNLGLELFGPAAYIINKAVYNENAINNN
jgi:hypothetical protein